jgi:hypothetical protein
MKNSSKLLLVLFAIVTLIITVSCDVNTETKSAILEQRHTEENQSNLNKLQPAPTITWSLERDNLIKRFKLQNDRSVMFYMYVFIEGISQPIGYYQVNKVSSVNSQLTNTEQIIKNSAYESGNYSVLPSPSEDGSYGTNGDAVFGFTPEEIYIEHNMKFIVATVPLHFQQPVNKLTVINIETENQLKDMMSRVNKNN